MFEHSDCTAAAASPLVVAVCRRDSSSSPPLVIYRLRLPSFAMVSVVAFDLWRRAPQGEHRAARHAAFGSDLPPLAFVCSRASSSSRRPRRARRAWGEMLAATIVDATVGTDAAREGVCVGAARACGSAAALAEGVSRRAEAASAATEAAAADDGGGGAKKKRKKKSKKKAKSGGDDL